MSLGDDVAKFVAESLPSDITAWCKHRKGAKIVHDSLWGTSRLSGHEIALLDTPLLQRLRFIHQTGGTYLTYPSALHTRFEHTLGVVHQSGRICQALRNRPGENRIDDGVERNVRFAAMLHDTGHGPFSHTSEQFFAALPEIGEFKSKYPQYQDSGAGEILSSLIVRSQPFRTFVDAINTQYQINLNVDDISNLITGTMGNNEMFLSEIVHGPFDADKLDYMPRDGMFSGLKMHVDLDRLFNSIDICQATSNEQTMTRLAGSVSGISPLTQIMFNKMLLFTGIYHHHKVRTVDCMLWAIFRLAMERRVPISGVTLNGPVDFLRLTDDVVLAPNSTSDAEINQIVSNIRNRVLWKRALIVSRRMTPESMHQKAGPTSEGRFPEFMNLSGNSQAKIERRRELARKIWTTAGKPCKEYEVWLDVPTLPPMNEARQMWIRPPGGADPQTLGEFIPIANWVELYGMHQWQSHVFCPPEVCEAIGQAAEKVFKDELGLTVLPTARAYKRRLMN